MLKSYDAVYDHGQLQWIQQPPPNISQKMRVIVVLEVPQMEDESIQERPYSEPITDGKRINEPSAEKPDIVSLLPKHRLGKIHSSLRREDIYTDAR